MTRWFADHDPARHLAGTADSTVAWLTGQSSLGSSTLSPGQEAVLDDVAAHGFTPVRSGFPYDAARAGRPYAKPTLVAASVRNGAQYLAARTSTPFAADVARHLQPLLDRTRSDLLLLCGSSGAALLAAAWPHLQVPPGLRVHVVGVGPVGRLPHPPAVASAHVIRGRWDLLSRWGSRTGPDDVTVPGGHLDYVTSPHARAAIGRVAATVRAAASTGAA